MCVVLIADVSAALGDGTDDNDGKLAIRHRFDTAFWVLAGGPLEYLNNPLVYDLCLSDPIINLGIVFVVIAVGVTLLLLFGSLANW